LAVCSITECPEQDKIWYGIIECTEAWLVKQASRSAGWNWRLELEWCERKILLDWLELELELVAGVV